MFAKHVDPMETYTLRHYDANKLLEMSNKITPYDYGDIDLIISALAKGLTILGISDLKIHDHLAELIKSSKLLVVINQSSPYPKMPHPVMDRKNKYIVVETRPFLTIDNGSIKSAQYQQLGLIAIRAMLILKSLESDRSYILSSSHAPAAIFSNWVANSIRVRFGVPSDKVNTLKITAALYFLLLCEDTDRVRNFFSASSGKMAYVSRLIRNFKASDNDAIKAVNAFSRVASDRISNGEIITLEYFIEALSTANDIDHSYRDPLLSLIKKDIFPTMIGSAYIGSDSSEISLVGVEHPETYLAMLALVSTDSRQTGSNLYKSGIRMTRDKLPNNYFSRILAN